MQVYRADDHIAVDHRGHRPAPEGPVPVFTPEYVVPGVPQGGGDLPQPVSYTHLDVYKRQPFRIAEDITRVKGIGEGTLAGLIDYITVE